MATTTSNVELLYRHPHIVLYLEDNTEQPETTTVENETGLYGIQVGAFEGGRDGVVLRYTNTAQMLEELGSPDYDKYGQAAYNAYNALNSKSCGMYIERVLSDNAQIANRAIMARFKVRQPKSFTEEVIDHVDTSATLVADKNAFSDLGSSALGSFQFYGTVLTGITGDNEVDSLFSHITPEWLNDHTELPMFTFATVRFSLPEGVTPGEKIKITQISKALKNFYADLNLDETITATGNTATKAKEYDSTALLEGTNQFDLCFIVQEDDTISLSIEWGDDANTVSDYTFSSANVKFTADTTPEAESDETTEDAPEEETKGLEIQYYAMTLAATTEDELLAKWSSLYNEEVDENGYYNMPFELFYSMGRGVYGNNLRIKHTDATDVEIGYPFHRYMITVMQQTAKEGLKEKEYIRGSLNETAWDDTDYADGTPAYFQDLVNDVEYGSQKINMQIVQPTLEMMLDLYNGEIADGEAIEELTLDTFDPLFGLDMVGEPMDTIIRSAFDGDTEKYDAVNLEAVEGFALMSGTDGDMTYKRRMTTEETAKYNKAYELALLRAFGNVDITDPETGKITTLPMYDDILKSRYCTPADFMFDANFPDTVKAKMAEFSNERKYDCMCYLDSGLNTTNSECIAWLRGMKDVHGFNVVKDVGCYKYRDSTFTRKAIPCTMTHFISKALPVHLTIPGIAEAFARSNAQLKSGVDFIAGSFFPRIDPDNHEVKKAYDNFSANCYEAIDRQTMQRATAITTCQNYKVDRADEFNEYILNRAIRIAYDIMNSKIYKVLTEDNILAYSEHAKKQIEFKLGNLVRNVSITMESSAVDKRKSILRLKLHIEFNTVCKYGVLEITLDPRGTADLEEAQLQGGSII